MTRVDEEVAYHDRYLVVEPNLDESAWRLNGRLPGFAGRIVTDALAVKSDTFPTQPDTVSRAARRADALWAISLDSLTGSDGTTIEDPTGATITEPAPVLTVFIDATNGQAGVVVVAAGPRVGEAAIEAILCDGIIEVTARTQDGTPLAVGRRRRVIPPQLRRFILDRVGAACTIAGCTSRYRLHVHHIVRWVDGGRSDPENLTTVCWFHHQVVIHGHGSHIDPDSPPQHHQLLHPPSTAPPGSNTPKPKDRSPPKPPKTKHTSRPGHSHPHGVGRRGPTARPGTDGAPGATITKMRPAARYPDGTSGRRRASRSPNHKDEARRVPDRRSGAERPLGATTTTMRPPPGARP